MKKKKKNNNIHIKIWILCLLLIFMIAHQVSYFINNSIAASLVNTVSQNPIQQISPDTSENPIQPSDTSLPFSLTLVNSGNSVSSSYYPENLINIFEKYGSADVPLKDRFVMMNEEAYLACREMFIAAHDAGIYEAYILSAYRDYYKQNELYSDYMKTGGGKDLYPLVSKPGDSEHHTGLAVDLAILSNYKQATNKFEATEQGNWFMQNCWYYGFILRYPEDKKQITGIAYESWHFRYVGKEHSVKMKNMNLCLEEYLDSLYN